MSNSDMSHFIRIFLTCPSPRTGEAQILRQRIKALPPRLQASGFHKPPSPGTNGKVQPGYLCDLHKHLKKGLCYETMSMLEHEISRVGRYTYSIVMSGQLDADIEMAVRQLEPLPQMYVPGFDVRQSAPEGHEFICPTLINDKGMFVPRWAYESSQCPACMLARIGTDSSVLSALLAGIVARISRRHRGRRDNLKSLRIRFVKEWLEAHDGGSALVDRAFAIGGMMRDIKRAQKEAEYKKAREGLHESRVGNSGHPRMHRHDRPAIRAAIASSDYGESVIGVDISDSYAPQHSQASAHLAPRPYLRADQDSAVEAKVPRPFLSVSASLRDNPFSSQEHFPRAGVRDDEQNSEESFKVGIDLSEPFVPRSRSGARDDESFTVGIDLSEPFIPQARARDDDQNSDQTFKVGFDLSEPFSPYQAHSQLQFGPGASVHDSAGHSSILVDRFNQSGLSIASSFASNVTLSNLRAPSANPTLVAHPLQPSDSGRPTIPARSMNRLQRPHPLSIYAEHDSSPMLTAGQYADVSPPGTPTGRDRNPNQGFYTEYDVSPPSSPELEQFATRPVTTWSTLYSKPAV